MKTNYDFSFNVNTAPLCNGWRGAPLQSRRMFGENSACTAAMVQDGLSNTIAMAERTYEVHNGPCSAWGYRAAAMAGVDMASWGGINVWVYPAYYPGLDLLPGRLIDWTHAGSLHPGGAHVLMADGSVHYLNETTDSTILERLSAMADGELVTIP